MTSKETKSQKPQGVQSERSWMRARTAAIPVIAMLGILIVGIAGITRIPSQIYIASFLIIAIIVFYIERVFFTQIQNETDKKFALIATCCQAFLAGDRNIRIQCPEGDNASELARTLNQLLTQYKNHLEKNYASQQEELHQLHSQLNQLAHEIKPVMDGDLRVKSTLRIGSIGAVAEVCNALIEDLARLIQWTQYMANHVLQITHTHQSRIGEWAQTTETLKLHFSTMTETVEKLVAFMLRLDSTLQASIDAEQDMLDAVQRQKAVHVTESDESISVTPETETAFFEYLSTEMQGQVRLLAEIASSAQRMAETAEPLLGELYAYTRQFQHSCTFVVKAAEDSSSLAMLAGNWSQAAQAFSVPEDSLQDGDIEDEQTMLQGSHFYGIEATTNQY